MSVLAKGRPEPPATVRGEPRVTDEHGRRIRVGQLVRRHLLLLAVLTRTVGPFRRQLSTSLKGPTEDICGSPPSFLSPSSLPPSPSTICTAPSPTTNGSSPPAP